MCELNNSLLLYLSKKKNLHKDLIRKFIATLFIIAQTETTQMFFSVRMNKQIVPYS